MKIKHYLTQNFKRLKLMLKKTFSEFYTRGEQFFSYCQLLLTPIIKANNKTVNRVKIYFKQHPRQVERIQFTLIYLFGVFDLTFNTLYHAHLLGKFPTIFEPLFEPTRFIVSSFLAKIWGSPERVFFVSFWILKWLVIDSHSNLSKFAKYHILLIFASMMTQNLIVNTFDFFINREISSKIFATFYGINFTNYIDKQGMSYLFFLTFINYLCFFIYCYIQALRYKLIQIKNLEWFTDSIAFWVKIKTPTMNIGTINKRKKKDDNSE